MTRLILFYVLFCTTLIFTASGSIADSWNKTSPCGPQSLGMCNADSEDITFTFKVEKWKPTVKYYFHGELGWDTSLGSTQGRIFLKKKGTSLDKRIADWSNPPETAAIEQDITKYIDGNGTYIIQWKYMGGRTGVCIMRSEINPAKK